MFKKILFAITLLASTAHGQSVIRQDQVKIGRGTSSDKSIVLDKGSGAANPAIKWNNSSSALQFTNDGTNYLDFGSGSGGSGGFSVLVNGDFESGVTTGWTYSGATGTVASSGSNLLIGNKSAVFDATANAEFFKSTLYTIPNGLYGRNCYAQILYKGGDANLSLQVIDGSSNVLATTVLATVTNPTKAYFNFICPTSGSMQLRVLASADAAAMALDQAFLGEAINIANISQSKVLVDARRSSTDQTISSTSETTVVWNAETVDTFSEFNISTGIYTANATRRLVISTHFYVQSFTASEDLIFRIRKSGSSVCDLNAPATSTTHQFGLEVCTVDVVAGDTLTWSLDSSADASYTVANSLASRIVITEFPTTQEMAIRPDLQFWKVDANISGSNVSMGTAAQNAYVEISNTSMTLTNNSGQGNIAAQIPCTSTVSPSGLNCGGNAESLGVAFTPTGTFPQEVLACVSFAWASVTGASVGTGLEAVFQLVETPTNAQTDTQFGKSRVQGQNFTPLAAANTETHPFRVCGNFTFTSGGQKVIRLKYEQTVSGGPTASEVLGDASPGIGSRDIHWEVYPINQGIPAPILVGSINSNSSGMERIERVTFDPTNGASCTIARQSGSWISSTTPTASGDCTLNIAAGIFSAIPTCSISATVADSGTGGFGKFFTKTSSAMRIQTIYQNGATTTLAYLGPTDVICMGPR